MPVVSLVTPPVCWILLLGGLDAIPFLLHVSLAIYGGRFLLISLIVNLVHVAKYPLLIALMRVCLTRLNGVV